MIEPVVFDVNKVHRAIASRADAEVERLAAVLNGLGLTRPVVAKLISEVQE